MDAFFSFKRGRKRLTRGSLTVIIVLTLIASWAIAWDRTRGNQKRLDKAVQLMAGHHHRESLELFNDVLKRWPRAKLALAGKGLCELNLELYDDALKSYNRILKIDPDNIQGLYGKGMTLEKLEQFEDALRCYEHIHRLDPAVLEMDKTIARVEAIIGNVD